MASCSILGKRKPEDDDLETKPVLKETKPDHEATSISVKVRAKRPQDYVTDSVLRKKTLYACNLAEATQISDIINFFKDVGQVVHVRLKIDSYCKPVGQGFVEFACANEAKKALEKKNGECLLGFKILLTRLHYDETEEAAVPNKTLFAGHFLCSTQISSIIGFFKDVGEVVRVRLVVDCTGNNSGFGFVEFASVNEAMKALEKKNGKPFFSCNLISLETAPNPQLPKFTIDHKVWYEEDYLQPIKEDETPRHFLEEVLLVANLSPQTTKIEQIIDFFKDVGEVVGVRLIVNHMGKHLGYGFVEFASAYEAKKALERKNGEYLHDHPILLMKGLDETPDSDEADAVRKKTLYVANLCRRTQISDIINFFKDVGQVVHVRFAVNHVGKHLRYGFVEFSSATKARKALKKNGGCLIGAKISLGVFKTAPNHPLPKYEDYLVRDEDAAAVEELDETPEEIDVRKKTLFVAKLPANMTIKDVFNRFNLRGDVVRARVIVDHTGEHVGCGFLEFASAYEANKAKKATEKRIKSKFYLNLAERERYPFRPKYNLAEELRYEDNLRRESLDYKTKRNREKQKKREKTESCGKKTIFSYID